MKTWRLFLVEALKHKLSQDIAWTFGSFFVLAASGILMNIAIVLFRDASALGVFNLAYAIYLIGSQVAVMGIHYSVMRHAAYYAEDLEKRGTMFASGAALSLLLGLAVGSAVYLSAPLFTVLFRSEQAAQAIAITGFGLMLFPLNKVLIGFINGLRHMRALAVLQATRYITVLFCVIAVSLSDLPFADAAWSFFIAELLTTVATFIYLAKAKLITHLRCSKEWLTRHVIFGGKGALGGIFLDMNTRIDVLLIGVFLTEREVGIYSFAAMLIDGVQHILSMLRVNFNPILVTATRDRQWELGKRLLRHSKIYVFYGTLILSLLILAAFYVAVTWFIPGKDLHEGLSTLAILLAGYAIISGYSPFDNILLSSGHPGWQTAQNMAIAMSNIALCLLLIPVLGIQGAALATATSYIVGIAMMLILSKKLLGWNLFTNVTPAG